MNTTAALARPRRFAQSMAPDLPPVDQALPAARELLASARVPFKVVGGLAVIHHGYARITEDLDLLLDAGSQESLDARLAPCGFARETPYRLRHRATGVAVHLLVAGEPMPRPGGDLRVLRGQRSAELHRRGRDQHHSKECVSVTAS